MVYDFRKFSAKHFSRKFKAEKASRFVPRATRKDDVQDKRKKNLSTRVSQHGGWVRNGEFRKSNRWDFHLIDIVFKINYVVYENLTKKEETTEKEDWSKLFLIQIFFSSLAYCFKSTSVVLCVGKIHHHLRNIIKRNKNRSERARERKIDSRWM